MLRCSACLFSNSDAMCSGELLHCSRDRIVTAKYETGPEHTGGAGTLPQPSYCTLPMFHPPSDPSVAPAPGYISNDGHHFDCRNPVVMQQAYHVYVPYPVLSTLGPLVFVGFSLQTGQGYIFLIHLFNLIPALDQIQCTIMIGAHYPILQPLQGSSLLPTTGLAQCFPHFSASGLPVQQPLDLVGMRLAGTHIASSSLTILS